MDYLDLLKVGSPLALALIIIWKVAEANLKALNSQRDDFMKVITNHMHEDIMMHQKTIETMTNIIVDYKGFNVSVGSGFSLSERNEYYNDPELIKNKIVTIKYFEETKNDQGGLSLRFPTFKGIRNYE